MVFAISANRTLVFLVLSICLAVIKTVPWAYKDHSAQSGVSAIFMVQNVGLRGLRRPYSRLRFVSMALSGMKSSR